MEKPLFDSRQQSDLTHSFPATVHRKPLPTPAASAPVSAPAPSSFDKEVQSSSPPSSPVNTHIEDTSNHGLPDKTPYPQSYSQSHYNAPLPPLPPLPSQGSSFHHRLVTRFTSLPKRTRYIYLAIPISIVAILIIGLAAGLATRNSHFSHLPLPSSHGGPYTGDLTYYDPGLGSCGITSTASDYIVAVSHLVYDAVSVGSNPNANPLCGKKIRASRDGVSVDLTVVDRCTGCKPTDLDVTRTVFGGLASIDQGRVGVTWAWLEDVPGQVA